MFLTMNNKEPHTPAIQLWVDDPSEEPPKGWLLCQNAFRAIEILQGGQVTRISLSYHLGQEEHVGTGRDVLLWILGALSMGFEPPEIEVHCRVPSQRQSLLAAVTQIDKLHYAP